MPEQFRPRGLTMLDCSKSRAGFDRVLMAVAATFLTVSATSALAQSGPSRNSPRSLRSMRRFRVPNLPTSRLRPSTISSPTPSRRYPTPRRRRKRPRRPNHPKSSPLRPPMPPRTMQARLAPASPTQPRTTPLRAMLPRVDTAATTREPAPATARRPLSRPRNRSRLPATCRRPISRSPKNCAKCSVRKSSRYFDRKAERAAVEKFYTAREFAPVWTQGGTLTASGKAVIARLKDAASDGLNAADYPVPDFAAATDPDALAEAELKLTASVLDYARQAQSGRMHWSQVSGGYRISRASH